MLSARSSPPLLSAGHDVRFTRVRSKLIAAPRDETQCRFLRCPIMRAPPTPWPSHSRATTLACPDGYHHSPSHSTAIHQYGVGNCLDPGGRIPGVTPWDASPPASIPGEGPCRDPPGWVVTSARCEPQVGELLRHLGPVTRSSDDDQAGAERDAAFPCEPPRPYAQTPLALQ